VVQSESSPDPSSIIATLAAVHQVALPFAVSTVQRRILVPLDARNVERKQRVAKVHHASATERRASPDIITRSTIRPASSDITYCSFAPGEIRPFQTLALANRALALIP
jgi:hypothetical protein